MTEIPERKIKKITDHLFIVDYQHFNAIGHDYPLLYEFFNG